MAHDAHTAKHDHHDHSAKPYYLTYGALLVLTVLTFALANIDLGMASFFIAMAIAVTKGTLVLLFFMHLIDQRGASRLTVAIALLFVALLITLSCSDVLTRFPLALPPGSFRWPTH